MLHRVSRPPVHESQDIRLSQKHDVRLACGLKVGRRAQAVTVVAKVDADFDYYSAVELSCTEEIRCHFAVARN